MTTPVFNLIDRGEPTVYCSILTPKVVGNIEGLLSLTGEHKIDHFILNFGLRIPVHSKADSLREYFVLLEYVGVTLHVPTVVPNQTAKTARTVVYSSSGSIWEGQRNVKARVKPSEKASS
jgi:hypothetical protein